MSVTIEQFILGLDKKLSTAKAAKSMELAVRSVHAEMMTRIFSSGLKSDGSKIGQYNATKPLYITDEQSPKKGSNRGKTGKPIESTYYKSYKDFRQKMGRESSFVNIRLTNDLQSDFANSELSKASNNLAKPNSIKVNALEYKFTLKRDININKMEGLEKKYGKIFNLTKPEKDKFYFILRKEAAIA